MFRGREGCDANLLYAYLCAANLFDAMLVPQISSYSRPKTMRKQMLLSLSWGEGQVLSGHRLLSHTGANHVSPTYRQYTSTNTELHTFEHVHLPSIFCMIVGLSAPSQCFTHQGARVAEAVPIILRKITFGLCWREERWGWRETGSRKTDKDKEGKSFKLSASSYREGHQGALCQRPSILGEIQY